MRKIKTASVFVSLCLGGLTAFLTFTAFQPAFAQFNPWPELGIPNEGWWDQDWYDKGTLPVPQNFAVAERPLTYKNGDVEVPAILYRPKKPGKYPAVLFQHGRAGLIDWVQRHARRLAARGFVVLAPDVYAARFIDPRPIKHDYATEGDVNAGLDALLKLPDVSTSRACLYSHTRGGYYTLKVAVTFKRQDDAAACYVSYYPHLQDPNAPEPEQVYRYASEANQMTLPTLVFIGQYEQYQRRRIIETAIKGMKALGRDATLVTYPGVGRGFDFRPDTIRTMADDLAAKDAVVRAARFIRKHLKTYKK